MTPLPNSQHVLYVLWAMMKRHVLAVTVVDVEEIFPHVVDLTVDKDHKRLFQSNLEI